ncbi:phosphatidylserine decarboxylase [Stackebrandtia nassauensis]|uniref:Phosphatidylserine decarboxylase n=1 Tax=Stackebrandtia nassauensis (strain DSM 44728 / CIP 108903 / NRRL B-16338 / NBRC 102104 / LLR-40K-21) TaxID=446470 RepID=D3Q446_STANL|nr:phosphatidylserine decarboxylase [Stackebrandtia nassauensis]ADD45931.1 Phosphatidylserine decarboxylase [Stackebrandtia nassauensis DSM 44728]
MSNSTSLGRRAARVLADEFIRHPGPKTGLVIGARPHDPVLAAAIDALLPDDRLTVVATDAERGGMEAYLAEQGSWVTERVTLVPSLSEAKAADVVMLAAPVTAELDSHAEYLRELTAPGGVLCLSAPLTAAAAEEIADLVGEHGIGSDLVLRNRPPVRIHRLRFSEADAALAERAAPATRSSSVPLTSRMHIDSNGLAAGAILLGVAGLTKKIRPNSKLWLLPAVAAAPAAAFFRDPQRNIDPDPKTVVASGDGKVLSVERVVDERFGAVSGAAGTEWLRIAVFLSILDVHVNRAPVAGRVVDIFREAGSNAPAMKPAAEHNVACYTVVDTPRGRVVTAQRTGMIARRIVNRTQVGAVLAKGERYGLIRFGSRTDVYLPADAADALVSPNDKVIGGETAIARWR